MDSNNFKKTALILKKDVPEGLTKSYANDSLDNINLIKAKPNYLLYSNIMTDNNQKNQDDWGRTYREQFTSQLDWLLDNMEPVTTKTGAKVKRRKQTEEMKHLISDVS